jgi:peroxiredoxin
MKTKMFLKIIIPSIFLCGLFLSSCSNNHADSAQSGAAGYGKAHAFTLNDVSGESFSLSDLSGKKSVLLVFTTTWCSHCVTIIPDLKRIYGTYKDKNIEILAVYIRESASKVSEFKAAHALPYKVLLDSDSSVAKKFNVRGVPTFVFVDKNGDIKYKGHDIPEKVIKQEAAN